MLRATLFFVIVSAASALAQEPTPRAATLTQQKMCDVQANKKFNESEASAQNVGQRVNKPL
jgi:hypothetical protein